MNPRLAELVPFLNMLGGLHWRVGQFSESADCYDAAATRAVDPDELNNLMLEGLVPTAVAPSLMRTLQADALKHAGRYREALNVCERTVSDPVSNTEHLLLVLNTASLQHIMSVTGIEDQDRKVPVVTGTGWAQDDLVAQLGDSDALSASLWLDLADISEESAFAYKCTLTAALANENHGELWALTVVRALEAGLDDDLIYGIVQRAVRLSRDEFIHVLESYEPGSAADESWAEAGRLMRQAVAESVSTAPDPNRPRVYF
jgi:tetratricopeptide (TPR) repeat protein